MYNFIREFAANGSVPDSKLRKFAKAYRIATGKDTLPTKKVIQLISSGIRNMTLRTVFYTYMPIALFLLIAIWLMVSVGWTTVIAGIILTTALIVMLYAFGISYRISVQNSFDKKLAILAQYLDRYEEIKEKITERMPIGIIKGLCAMNDPNFPDYPTPIDVNIYSHCIYFLPNDCSYLVTGTHFYVLLARLP